MADLVLYHSPGSRSERVRIALELSGLPYSIRIPTESERSAAAYRALHPLGQVPLLLVDGQPVIESAAQILTIADLAPGDALAPSVGTPERAQYYAWIIFGVATMEPTVNIWRHAQTETSRLDLIRCLTVVEDRLSGPWLLGERFTAADVLIGWGTGFCDRVGLLDGLPRCRAHAVRLSAMTT
ncbi:MAG: glutathione S-transferase family protein [Myxococcota bacterium]